MSSDSGNNAEVVNDGTKGVRPPGLDEEGQVSDNASTIDATTYAYSEDRKIGVTGAVFLILNKMIGTGSKWSSHPLSHRRRHVQ
jgi:hypothetical protein